MQFIGIGFLIMIFLEIMSIVWVADWLGGGITFLLMILSFLTGAFMLRHTGISGLLMAGSTIKSGSKVSMYELLWPIRYTIAALLLMSPGFASMIVAFILLLPIKGKPISESQYYQNGAFRYHSNNRDDVIEGEYTVENESPTNQTPQQTLIENQDSSHQK